MPVVQMPREPASGALAVVLAIADKNRPADGVAGPLIRLALVGLTVAEHGAESTIDAPGAYEFQVAGCAY